MLLTILTIVKKMSKLMTIPRFWGPFATIVFTVLYHLGAVYFGFTIAVGWLWIFAAVGAFIGGRWAGLISAAWAGMYAYYVMPAGDWVFTAQRVVIGFLLAGLVSWQSQSLRRTLAEARAALERADYNEAAAQALNALNGNIHRIKTIRLQLLEVLKNRPLDEDTRGEIRTALHVLNNLELATAGWRALDKLKHGLDEEFKGEESDIATAKLEGRPE